MELTSGLCSEMQQQMKEAHGTAPKRLQQEEKHTMIKRGKTLDQVTGSL